MFKGKKVLTRGYRSGVHYGTIVKVTKDNIYLKDSRRVWSWQGAASLSELAAYGAKDTSKIGVKTKLIAIARADISEVISCEKEAVTWFEKVAPWRC